MTNEYAPCGCLIVKLNDGTPMLIDADDAYRMHFRWYRSSNGYAVRWWRNAETGKRHPLYFHRLTLDISGVQGRRYVVDHIDGDRLHNGRHNLRWATAAQNMWNRRAKREGKTSQYKGVCFIASSRLWQARICFEGRVISLRSHKTEEEAGLAYNEAALRLYGRYAHINAIEARGGE